MASKFWINDGSSPKPKSDLFYELAANGIFKHEKTGLWHSVTQVEEINGIKERNPELKLAIPPLPRAMVKEVVRFFAWIFGRYGTEVMVVLCYSPQDKDYSLLVPSQRVSAGHISYNLRDEIKNRPRGYRLIGTIHSHCDFSAFHSGIDEGDEAEFDGLHFTFGNFSDNHNARSISISGEAAIGGTRFKLNPAYWLQGLTKIRKKSIWSSFYESPSEFFRFSDGAVILPANYKPDEVWMQKVKARKPKRENQVSTMSYDYLFPQKTKDEESSMLHFDPRALDKSRPSKDGYDFPHEQYPSLH